MQNEKTSLSENVNPKKGKNETISELAHRHLRDENHSTSDEELRNATVELTDDSAEANDTSLYEADNTPVTASETGDELSAGSDVKSEDGDDDDDIPNPYSVLSK